MKIKYRYGDILTTESKYIAHCVNMQYVMNSGVAKCIRESYPKAYEDYMSSELKLGRVIISTNEPHNIIHIVGQEFYGRTGLYVKYQALEKAFKIINSKVESTSISYPLIGCGLAGGDWNIVSRLLEENSSNYEPIVYILNDRVPY